MIRYTNVFIIACNNGFWQVVGCRYIYLSFIVGGSNMHRVYSYNGKTFSYRIIYLSLEAVISYFSGKSL